MDRESDATMGYSFKTLFLDFKDYFGQRLTSRTYEPDFQTFTGVLYGAVQIRGRLDVVAGEFSVVILLGLERTLRGGAGGPFVSAADAESVRGVFAALDAEVRLRLPDEYLAEFEVPFDRDLQFYGKRRTRPSAGDALPPDLVFPELNAFVLEFFGSRLSFPTSDGDKKEMTGLLYDAFPFSCGIDSGKPIFYAGIGVGYQAFLSSFMGVGISMNRDRESVLESLRLVDRYCRLRLPDKYREAFVSAYGLESDLSVPGGE